MSANDKMSVVESSDVSEEMLGMIRPHFSKVKIPVTYDKVYKDECMFSFDTPFSPGGLFVSLRNWHGFGEDYLALAVERGAGALYLHEVWRRVPKAVQDDASMDTSTDTGASKPEPTVLALGIDGGFRTDEQKYDVVKTHRLVVLKDGMTEGFSVPFPHEALPTIIGQIGDAIIEHQGAAEQLEVNQWVVDDELVESKYARDLPFVDTGCKVSSDPKTWVCGDSGKTENLWLNLSTGYIGSGRQNWDGSGGTGAALRHYEETGRKYPLAAKLGTITPQGADVYSYAPDENRMVKDSKLAEHLARWGIDMAKLEKTDKTMTELEVELNNSYDFNKITEAGGKLKPLSGPGYTGIKNLGNSCYMNSCLQVLSALPEVQQRYAHSAPEVFKTAQADIAGDFSAQMSKVVSSLLSGKYSKAPSVPATDEMPEGAEKPLGKGDGETEDAAMDVVVAPRMFKHLVGRGHSEFSTGKQQDVVEYIQHLLEIVRRSERTSAARLGGGEGAPQTPSLFQFRLVDRLQCLESKSVKYTTQAATNLLNLQIPIEAAVNKGEVEAYKERLSKRQKFEGDNANAPAVKAGSGDEEEEEVKPMVPLSACIDRFFAEEMLTDYRSPATGEPGTATKRVRVDNFPRYLMIQLGRYYQDAYGQVKKLDVEVDVPLSLDLNHLRSAGIQADEVAMPVSVEDQSAETAGSSSAVSAPAGQVVPDEQLVSQLMNVGFEENGCRRAVVAVNNASLEMAMNWVLEHHDDADFNDPLPEPGVAPAGANPEAIAQLSSLGFTARQAEAALKATRGDLGRGADWLFSHADDLDTAVAKQLEPQASESASTSAGSSSDSPLDDGAGRYSLVGFISHVGKNTSCGHYVAHIRKDGRWAIFDDRKVAESEHPPFRLGYLYFFERDG